MSATTQALEALERANEVRLGRARIKREIREGRLSVGDALDFDCVGGMRVFDLLQAQKRWGSAGPAGSQGVKAKRLLGEVGVSLYRTVGALTPRQRAALMAQLEGGDGA